jgi:hypothetical protein
VIAGEAAQSIVAMALDCFASIHVVFRDAMTTPAITMM